MIQASEAVPIVNNPCHVEYYYILHPSLVFLSCCKHYHQLEWKTVQILIRYLCQKPADLDLQCFQNRCSAGQGLIIRNHFHVRIQKGESGQGSGPPLKNHKAIRFLGSPKNHKATKPAFNFGPLLARQRKQKMLSELDPGPPLTKLSGSAHDFKAANKSFWYLNILL